jgi:hypothetical protein
VTNSGTDYSPAAEKKRMAACLQQGTAKGMHGFELRDFTVVCIAEARLTCLKQAVAQKLSRATSASGSPATVARQSPSCAEQKSAWGHARRPKEHPRQRWGSAPAPFRLASVIIRRNTPAEFNLPQPGVSIIFVAP